MSNVNASPVPPHSADIGVWFCVVLKKEFPLPPEPPLAARNIVSSFTSSATISRLRLRNIVPIGTSTILFSPLLNKKSVKSTY